MWESVQSFSAAARQARTLEELNDAFAGPATAWGFDRFGATLITSSPDRLRQPITRTFGRANQPWVNHYRSAGHIGHDPAIRRIMGSIEPFWWSEAEVEVSTKREQVIFDEARDFRLNHGLVVPVRLADGSIWSGVLLAEHLDEDEAVKLAAIAVASLYVNRGATLLSRQERAVDNAFKLTPRQREVVTLLARGLSANEIGEVLGTSGKTVSHQVEDSKQRLGAKSGPGLVAEAILRGEIILD